MKNKKYIQFGIILIAVIMSVSLAGAYKKLCLSYGQSIPSEEIKRYTCWHDLCEICVTDNNYPTAPYRCNDISGCVALGNTSVDGKAPNLTVNSPFNNGVYTSTKILFDLLLNEPASIYYIDNINNGKGWKRICSDCKSYFKQLSMKEGKNNITIKATDRNGNSVEINRYFYVDSKKPKILKTLPTKGFASGDFEVQFQEDNPKSLVLNYGNSANGYNTRILNIINECYFFNKNKYECNVNVNLSKYNSQYIEYWFELTDIADSSVLSKRYSLQVDSLAPVINNNPHFYEVNGKYVYFNFNITEENFDKILYKDNDAKTPRWLTLCSRLKNGICEVKKTFSKGFHSVDIQVNDKAGNSVGENIEFEIM